MNEDYSNNVGAVMAEIIILKFYINKLLFFGSCGKMILHPSTDLQKCLQ